MDGQEAFPQQAGEFDTSSCNAAESNVQLCDELSAAVNTSGSKDEPADETSPQATGNYVNVDNQGRTQGGGLGLNPSP